MPLEVSVQESELYDEKNEQFVTIPGGNLKLEHSLLSISKWESKWHVPFLNDDKKTNEKTLDYIRCMTINNVNQSIYGILSPGNIKDIQSYIANPMTATTIKEIHNKSSHNRELVTSELIYYWMVANGIPFECEKWHINRLIMLIRVCNAKNTPPKKMSQAEILRQNRELNRSRRASSNSRG